MSRRSRRIGLMVLASALALTLTGVPARAAIRARPDATPVTDGTVYAVARSPDRIYVGGDFTRVMPRIGPFAILSPESGQPTGSPPEVSGGAGRVDCVIADGSGGFYIGGSFTHVAGVVRHNAAHVLADGTLDPDWDPEVSGEVLTLARLGSTVYLGGVFHGPGSINGNVTREYLAAVDATTGQALGWAPNPDEEVVSLAADGSTVYFSGLFEHADGVARYRAAAVDATSGAITPWDPHPEGGAFLSIAVSGSTVYVGGSFAALNGAASGRLAAVDATSGALKWSAPVGGIVWALSVSGSTVYFGGEFASFNTGEGPVIRRNAAAVNTLGVLQTWNPNVLGGRVKSIAAAGSSVYVAGEFSGPAAIGGSAHSYLAATDPTSGAVTGWNPQPTAAAGAVAISGGSIGAGGSFASVGAGVPRHNLAAFSAANGSLLPWAPEPDLPVKAILPDGDRVFVGGGFNTIGSRPRPTLAAIDADTGIATEWNPVVSGTSRTVNTMQLVGSTLYFGGVFEQLNGNVNRRDAGAVDANSGIATGFDPNVNQEVTSMLVEGSSVYLAGPFTAVGGVPRFTAAAVDSATGAVLPWNPDVDSNVFALAGSGSTIYLGGAFSAINGETVTRRGAAAVDATTGAVKSWDMGLPTFAVVKALAVSGSTVYVGANLSGVTAVDATTGASVGWNPISSGGEVLALATDGAGGVLVGGSFTSFDQSPQATIASFSEPPSPIAPPVVTGTSVVGQTLSCSDGSWAGSLPQSHAFVWLRGDAAIDGAVASRYTLAGADAGQALRCRVTASNLAGSASATSDPVNGAAATAGGARDTTPPPVVSALKLKPSSFHAAKRGPSIVAKRYARVSYRLSEAATVTFTVQRRRIGRRRGRSCVKSTPKLRHAKKCSRYVAVHGSFSRSVAAAGGDRFNFSGRVGGHALPPGRYRLSALATDASGNRSKPAIRAFHILKP